ncbi:unnamed protein product, partial [Leptidea sinapis]
MELSAIPTVSRGHAVQPSTSTSTAYPQCTSSMKQEHVLQDIQNIQPSVSSVVSIYDEVNRKKDEEIRKIKHKAFLKNKRIKALKQQNARLKKKVSKCSEIISSLKEKLNLDEFYIVSGMNLKNKDFFIRYMKKATKSSTLMDGRRSGVSDSYYTARCPRRLRGIDRLVSDPRRSRADRRAGVAMEVSLVSTMGERGREATCAALHGGLLVLGFSGGGVGVWRWRGGRGWSPAGEARRAHRYGTTAVSLAPAGALLASAGVDGVARVWDARAGRPLGPRAALAAPQPAAARVVRWAAAGERLAVGYDDGALRVWLTRSATVAALLLAHEDAVRAICLLADEALLLTACAGGVLKVFDFLDVCDAAAEGGGGPRPLFWEDGVHELGVVCAADDGGGVAATGGGVAATGGHDGRLRLWSVTERRVLPGRALCGHSGAVTDLQFSAELLASASMDRTARIWSPARAACLKVLHGHTGYLTCLAISSQEPFFLVTGSNDNTVRTWSSGGVSVPDEMDAACPVLSHFALGDLE